MSPRSSFAPRPSRTFASLVASLLGSLALSVTAGCGSRDAFWNAPPSGNNLLTWGFPDAVAMYDSGASRLAVVKPNADLTMQTTFVPLEGQLVSSAVTPVDGQGHQRLLMVTTPLDPSGAFDDGSVARLILLDPADPMKPTKVALSRALRGVSVDPLGAWAVLYATDGSGGGSVVNPNELILVPLQPGQTGGDIQVRAHTLRSFGGSPRRFTFTPTLQLPGGAIRLLAVETDKDVALVNLNPEFVNEADLTVQLTNGVDTRSVSPAGLVYTDGDPAANDDARLAIRLAGDSSIVVVQLSPAAGRTYGATINLVDVGGVPADAAFVRTDGGALALAALVPSTSSAVLVDPATSTRVDVALPAPFTSMSLVTSIVNGAPSDASTPDVALLWSPSVQSVSFWALGRAVGKPYRSLESVSLSSRITDVVDLPAPHQDRKLLVGLQQSFFLLDLTSRTVDPFLSGGRKMLRTGVSGLWAWAFAPGDPSFSRLDLATKHPDDFRLSLPIDAVYEVATQPSAAGTGATHAVLALHQRDNVSVTVLDADAQGASLGRQNVVPALFLAR